MIQPQSFVNVADNTGAQELLCIRILGHKKQVGSIGDIIIGVVKRALPNLSIQKAQIVRAVIIRTKVPLHRNHGLYLRFDNNSVVILNNKNNPRGTRIFGPVPYELREKKFTKLISLATELI